MAPEVITWCYDPWDTEWGWYWVLNVGGERVNGGLARDRYSATREGHRHYNVHLLNIYLGSD